MHVRSAAITVGAVVVAMATTIGAPTWGASGALAAGRGPHRPAVQPLWTATYGDSTGGYDSGNSVAVSPDGAKVYVTGYSGDSHQTGDYFTIAYDAASGARIWSRRYNGPANGQDFPYAEALDPSGSLVFVTGASDGLSTGSDYATVAYRADTGLPVWAARYDDPDGLNDYGYALSVSPDGTKVFVTGDSEGSANEDFATVAYDSATGALLWASRYDGPGHGDDAAFALAVDPDGLKVYVTGPGASPAADFDYETVAFDTGTGLPVWAETYDGPAHGYDFSQAVAVAGSSVSVTGYTTTAPNNTDFGTVAYDRTTGAQLWEATYDGPAQGADVAEAVGASPDGSTVYVTGSSTGLSAQPDFATVFYDSATGAQGWVARYVSPAHYAIPSALGVSPDGSRVYVTGHAKTLSKAADYATVAYDAGTGATVWGALAGGKDDDFPNALAVSPTGSGIYVTGEHVVAQLNIDWATLHYGA